MANTSLARHRDGLDAGLVMEAWLDECITRLPHREITRLNYQDGDGSVTVLWCDSRAVGIATIFRDDMNFTLVSLWDDIPKESWLAVAEANRREMLEDMDEQIYGCHEEKGN